MTNIVCIHIKKKCFYIKSCSVLVGILHLNLPSLVGVKWGHAGACIHNVKPIDHNHHQCCPLQAKWIFHGRACRTDWRIGSFVLITITIVSLACWPWLQLFTLWCTSFWVFTHPNATVTTFTQDCYDRTNAILQRCPMFRFLKLVYMYMYHYFHMTEPTQVPKRPCFPQSLKLAEILLDHML